jgi:hypothetical protein
MGVMSADSYAWESSVWERSLTLIVYPQAKIAKTGTSSDGYDASRLVIVSNAVGVDMGEILKLTIIQRNGVEVSQVYHQTVVLSAEREAAVRMSPRSCLHFHTDCCSTHNNIRNLLRSTR